MSTSKEHRIRLALEALSGFAVLIGLVFLGLQLRQNTAAIQAATFQDLVHTSSQFNVAIATNPVVRGVYLAGWQNPEGFDESEREVWLLLQSAYWARMQNVFFQYQRGTLTEADWQAYRVNICGSAVSPGGNAHWRSDGILTPLFKDFLESCGN